MSTPWQQEPGSNGTEILNSLKYVRPGDGFVPNFQLAQKSDVNGESEHPLYTYMKVSSNYKPHFPATLAQWIEIPYVELVGGWEGDRGLIFWHSFVRLVDVHPTQGVPINFGCALFVLCFTPNIPIWYLCGVCGWGIATSWPHTPSRQYKLNVVSSCLFRPIVLLPPRVLRQKTYSYTRSSARTISAGISRSFWSTKKANRWFDTAKCTCRLTYKMIFKIFFPSPMMSRL